MLLKVVRNIFKININSHGTFLLNNLQIQFATALALGVNGLRIECEFPLWMHYTLIGYMVSFLVLFGNFYIGAYITDHKRRQQENKQVLDNNNVPDVKNHNVVEKKVQ